MLNALVHLGDWEDAEPLIRDVAGQVREIRSMHTTNLLRSVVDRVGRAGAPPAVMNVARGLVVADVTERAAVVSGLEEEQPRYYLQHALGFQVHDVRHPHIECRHGRADIGWKDGDQNG